MAICLRLLLSCGFLTIAACGQTKLSDLPTEYTQTIRDLGFQPVYPPREGLQVGDVYFRAVHRGNPYDPHKNHSVLVGSLPEMTDMWKEFANSRHRFVDTLGDEQGDLSRQLDFDTATQEETRPKRRRMLQLAFPNVTASISKGSSGGLFGSVLSVVGVAAQTERVTVSFPEVRFMTVPFGLITNWNKILKLIVDRILPFEDEHIVTLQRMHDFPGCEDKDYVCSYTIITTVYYVRLLNYIFGDATSLALSAGIVKNGIVDIEKKPMAIPVIVSPIIVDSKAEEEEVPDQVATAIKESMGKALGEFDRKSISVGAAQASQHVFQIRQTFSQPVAIAWEGYPFSASEFPAPTGGQ